MASESSTTKKPCDHGDFSHIDWGMKPQKLWLHSYLITKQLCLEMRYTPKQPLNIGAFPIFKLIEKTSKSVVCVCVFFLNFFQVPSDPQCNSIQSKPQAPLSILPFLPFFFINPASFENEVQVGAAPVITTTSSPRQIIIRQGILW